jgi:hypothetical protein
MLIQTRGDARRRRRRISNVGRVLVFDNTSCRHEEEEGTKRRSSAS